MKYLNQDYLIKMASNDKQRLQDKLILNQYMCSLFKKNIKSIEGFQSFLADGDLEGIDEKTSRIRFTTILETQCPNMVNWLKTKLDIYDQNIQEYLEHINFKREKPIQLKYYQYLAILFNEIYLDRYYNEREKFIDDLYDFSDKFNENKQERDWVEFDENNLSKITFWSSTGSGKTFFIHINYLQALKYIKSSEHQIDNILLITPNESLSKQHIEEFELSNIPARTFENRTLLNYGDDSNIIKVIEITKLAKEKKGDGKSIQLEQFGENNIIFVDEGHRGSSGKEWKENREAIKGKGFMFEYSATFGQVANSDPLLFKEYSRSIIFDYSYRYFHMDGFGKDYSIFNLEQTREDYSKEYFVGSLLSFYEQKLHYNREKEKLKYFNLDSPLMLYVGSKVNTQENSDILDVIKLFIFVLNKKEDVIKLIENNLDPKKSNLLNKSTPIFQDKFPLLKELISSRDLSYEIIYEDILNIIFNKRTSNVLELHDLKKNDGEIGLSLGDNNFFGVINVGDNKTFLKLIMDKINPELVKVEENNFTESLFFSLDSNDQINFLIGSKKFMEGWNSFRVSQICLLNIGKSEGSQVIQLFGRGVRLKGYNRLLKRTNFLLLNHSIPEYIEVLKNIEINETLNIFGLNAKYISEFKEILEKEGIREYEEMTIPIELDNFPKNYKLFIPKVPNNIIDQFTKKTILISKNSKYNLKTSLDLRSKIEILESERDNKGILRDNHYQEKEMKFPKELINFINFDKVFLEISKYKEIKKLNHIYFEKAELKRILYDEEISIFGNENLLNLNKEFDSIEKLDKITDYAVQIIKSYIFKFYNKEKANYFKDKFEYEELFQNNEFFFPKEYVLTYERNTNKVNVDFSVIKKLIDNKKIYEDNQLLVPAQRNILESLVISEHIFKPLIYKNDKVEDIKELKISPNALVDSERTFLKDLTNYLNKKAKELEINKLFLLRNPPRKGVGFFESKNFYPDFIMWIQRKNNDYITFIDPKGLVYVDPDDEKLELSQRIKEVELDLNEKYNKSFILNSFILSITDFDIIKRKNKKIISQKELEDNHILFLEDKNSTENYYLEKMFSYIFSSYNNDNYGFSESNLQPVTAEKHKKLNK